MLKKSYMERHRRTKEEVAAAKQLYVVEKQKKRAEKELERERILEERARKKAQREFNRAKRLEQQKEAREKRISSKSPKLSVPERWKKLKTYKGKVGIGDFVAAKFAGTVLTGKVIEIDIRDNRGMGFEGNEDTMVTYYLIQDREGWKYPVFRADIVSKKED